MGRHFGDSDLKIDRIVTSSANRALSTAQRFRDAFDSTLPLTVRRDAYHADEMDLLAIAVEEAGDDPEARVMLVGHNPGMHDLALFLCGDGPGSAVDRLGRKFPTGALAEFDLDGIPGPDLEAQAGRLIRFVRPKDLPDAKRLEL